MAIASSPPAAAHSYHWNSGEIRAEPERQLVAIGEWNGESPCGTCSLFTHRFVPLVSRSLPLSPILYMAVVPPVCPICSCICVQWTHSCGSIAEWIFWLVVRGGFTESRATSEVGRRQDPFCPGGWSSCQGVDRESIKPDWSLPGCIIRARNSKRSRRVWRKQMS